MFGNIRRPGARAAQARVEAWTRARFALAPEATVLAIELACRIPGCPPVETVVTFWEGEGARYRFKLFKPLADVAEDDLPFRWLKPALLDEDELGLSCC